jgi:hypothetical protein
LLKLAIFVEGKTERLFVQRLIVELADESNVVIDHKKIRGGNKVPRTMSTITATKTITNQKYYVLIIDCGGDAQVKTRILQEHQNFTNDGYSKIIGLRDVRPGFTIDEIPQLEQGLRTHIKTALVPVVFVLSTMELEAWFLAEINHYQSIDESLSIQNINKLLNTDLENSDVSLRDNPEKDLNEIYMSVGKTYIKGEKNITIDKLDIGFMYLELTKKITQLKKLTDHLEMFLA